MNSDPSILGSGDTRPRRYKWDVTTVGHWYDKLSWAAFTSALENLSFDQVVDGLWEGFKGAALAVWEEVRDVALRPFTLVADLVTEIYGSYQLSQGSRSAGEFRGLRAYRGQARTGTSADESRNKREAMKAGVLDGLTAGLTKWARETLSDVMLPETVYPSTLPLHRNGALKLLTSPNNYQMLIGAFITLVKVPTDARAGDWCFAGISRSLVEATDRVEAFIAPLGGIAENGTLLLEYLLEPIDYEEEWHFAKKCPIEGLSTHRLVLCVQSDAPFDNTGVCILEVPTPQGDVIDFEEAVLAEWRKEATARMLEAGTRLWGPPPAGMQGTLERRSKPDDWVRWSQSGWGDWRGWSLDEKRNGPSGWDDTLLPS